MKVLVLGSNGVIGSSVVKSLKLLNHQVIEWDIKNGVKFDLRIQDSIDSILPNVDFVFFLAFDVGGSKYSTYNFDYISNNIKIIEYTFQSLKKYNKPFIHLTSQMSNMHENPYGTIKCLAEHYTNYLNGLNIKVWNVYGYEEINEKSHVISDWIHQAIHNNEIKMLSNGEEERQFMHQDDFANAMMHIMDNFDILKAHCKTPIDISSFKWIKIKDIATIIKKYCNEKYGLNIVIKPSSYVSTFQSITNQPKVCEYIKWLPKIDIQNGIQNIIDNEYNKLYNNLNLTKTSLNDGYFNTLLDMVVNGTGDSDKHALTLFSLALSMNAKNILELGTRSGNTTLPLLLAAHMTNGHLNSVDIEQTPFKAPQELVNNWTFIQSDAIEFLSKHSTNTPYDIIYIDDWHAYKHVKKELELIDSMVSPSSIIVIHDLMYGNNEPSYHSDLTLKDGQWADGGPYRAVAELNSQFWEFSTIPINNGLTILRKKYSSRYKWK